MALKFVSKTGQSAGHSMSFTFEAKYPGRCGACDGPFGPGDLVTYTDDELVHATCSTEPCAEEPQPVTYARLEAAGGTDAVCRSCWTIHAGECL